VREPREVKKMVKNIFKVFLCAVFLVMLGASVSWASDFSVLEIREIAVKGHKLHIRGDVDLPQGAMIHLALNIPGLGGPGNSKDVKVHVNSNHFFVQVRLPKKGREGDIWSGLIRAIFRPSQQDEHIKKKVGNKGENLKGAKVKIENGEKILVDIKNISF
jgi:hypothetical protein